MELLPASWFSQVRATLEREAEGAKLVITKLRDESGVVVVFPWRGNGVSNAKIVDRDGKVRCDLEIPQTYRDGIGFWDVYYVKDELTAIYVTNQGDFAFVIDEKSGGVLRTYETR